MVPSFKRVNNLIVWHQAVRTVAFLEEQLWTHNLFVEIVYLFAWSNLLSRALLLLSSRSIAHRHDQRSTDSESLSLSLFMWAHSGVVSTVFLFSFPVYCLAFFQLQVSSLFSSLFSFSSFFCTSFLSKASSLWLIQLPSPRSPSTTATKHQSLVLARGMF